MRMHIIGAVEFLTEVIDDDELTATGSGRWPTARCRACA